MLHAKNLIKMRVFEAPRRPGDAQGDFFWNFKVSFCDPKELLGARMGSKSSKKHHFWRQRRFHQNHWFYEANWRFSAPEGASGSAVGRLKIHQGRPKGASWLSRGVHFSLQKSSRKNDRFSRRKGTRMGPQEKFGGISGVGGILSYPFMCLYVHCIVS